MEEQLNTILLLWSGLGLAACLVFLVHIYHYKRDNPDFLTENASPLELLKTKRIILGYLSAFLCYCVLLLLILSILYQKTGLTIVSSILMIVFIIMLIAGIKAKA